MIRQLPPSVRSQIRSGVAITSITQCVEELLLNAVDAGSRCVAVRIDLSCFRVQVVDNGTGIAADQLDKIGQRYSTSKCQAIEDLESLGQFGYRGEALASIRDVAYILEVTSRARCSAQTYCKIFQQGKSLDTVESKVHRPSPGTTITVHNLFYNLPVRQKSISMTLEMENICHRIEALALMQPALSITLRNETTGSVLLQTHKTNSPLVTFSYLFSHSKSQTLVSVSKSVGYFYIKGYIGKESHYRKDLQFIYVNKRLVLKTQLHKSVNRLLKKSLIVRQRQALDTGEKLSPSKQADKYPVFVLNIQCPLNTYDITFDPRKTMVEFVNWDMLSTGVEEMCKEFLHKENLLTVDCLLSEERNKNDNQKMSSNDDANKLLVDNYKQTAFGNIDDEMFNNVRTRCLKSCPIKRLFEDCHSKGNMDFEQHTANKQCKIEVSSENKVSNSDNINFHNNSIPSSLSVSSFTGTQPAEVMLSVLQKNISNESKLLPHQNSTLVPKTISESEKMPFEEPNRNVGTQMVEVCSSDCESNLSQEDSDLSQKNSAVPNYINERFKHGSYKQMLRTDDVETEGWWQMYNSVSCQSSCSEETSNSLSKSVPLAFKLNVNETCITKHEACKKSKDSGFGLPSGKNVLSVFRSAKRNSKELPSVKMTQSTRSILDQFRAPRHKRETTQSAVKRIKPDMKTFSCLEKRNVNLDLEKDCVKDNNSEEQQISLSSHQLKVKMHPQYENLSVEENEMLKKLLVQGSSRNSIASKLSKLYKNDGMKNCSPSETEISLTSIYTGQNEKYKSYEDKEKECSEDHLENEKINQVLSKLNPIMEMCCVKDSRTIEIEDGFTALKEHSDNISKSVPSLEVANPLLNFGSVVDKSKNPDVLTCKQNLEKTENVVRKKRPFLSSSTFLQTLDSINLQNLKKEASHEKESQKKCSKTFDSGCIQYIPGERHDGDKHFSNSRDCYRTRHYQLHGNVCLPSCSNDETNSEFCDNSSKVILFSKNKNSSNQLYSTQDKNTSSEQISTESLQLAQSLSMKNSVEKSIKSLDFSTDKDSTSPPNSQDTAHINCEQDILNSNFYDGTLDCKWKENSDTRSVATVPIENNYETEKSCSMIKTLVNKIEHEEKILQKRNQINPVSNKEKTITYKGETCSKFIQEQTSNQKSEDTSLCLDEIPKSDISKMWSKNPEISSKSFKMLTEMSEVSSACPQMSSKTCEMLSDTCEKLEEFCQISNGTSDITSPTPETLSDISVTLSDTHKTLNDTFEVANDMLTSFMPSPIISSNAPKIISNTSEVTIRTSIKSENTQNSQLTSRHCNSASLEATTNPSKPVSDISQLNEESDLKLDLTDKANNSPNSSTLISVKLSSPLFLEASSHKTSPQRETLFSESQDFLLRKTDDDFRPSLIKQTEKPHLLSLRPPSTNGDPDSNGNDLIKVNHCKHQDSDQSSQKLDAECVSKILSQEPVRKIQYARENSRNLWIQTETNIQQSFSDEVNFNQDVEKSSDTSSLALMNSSGTEDSKTLVLPKLSVFSKSEEVSSTFETSIGVCIDSHKIHLKTKVDHLENSETMLSQDLVSEKETIFQPITSTDLDLNKCQQSDDSLLESIMKTNESLEKECIQNPNVKTDESYSQNLNTECDDNDDEKENELNIVDESETDFTLKLWRNWKNPVFQIGETDVLDIWTNHSVQRKLHRITHSCQFTKAMLSQMETIGQVDNKFIACIVKSKSQDGRYGIPDHLLMIDQHAAHERVRLEQLTADMYQSENNEEKEKLAVKFSWICPPWTLSLSDKEIRIVSSFLDEFSKIGLQLKVHQESNIIEIHTAPSCIMTREASERKHNRNTVAVDLVQAVIKEKIELLHDTRGAHSTIPKTIHNLLCSQACHGAIKFNDPLALVECQNLLKMLLKCKLPFQCAHGRPSVVPLLNFEHLKRILTKPELPKVNLKKLKRRMEEEGKKNFS